ncbi:DUF6461 domain-containing protein [Lentzea sp. CA-135723]|uniref:DUF6461 domain-containing protein n=1 Tax=Lentzea sp. CA-135723 TaxID=3239950 RepID=UPI003D946172
MTAGEEPNDGLEWVRDPATVMWCVTCVQNMSAEDLLLVVGAEVDPDVRWNAQEAQIESHRQGGSAVRVASAGSWAILIELMSLKGADGTWLEDVSRGRTAVCYYQTGGGMERFSLAIDGVMVTEFEPAIAAHRTGSSPDRLVAEMRAAGIDPDGAGGEFDLGAAALELVDRLTGVRLTSEMVVSQQWPAAVIPRRRPV